ncbi:MAG: heme-binding protein, partial [Pirellulales bacterium]
KDFPTGIMRGRFHPQDGQLYLCGLVGWSSNKSQPGGFYRVRYNGKPLYVPVNMHATEDGVQLTFSDALDKSSAEDIDNYVVHRWNYRWTRGYGSKHYSVKDPKRTGQDEVEVLEATLSADGRMLELELDDMKPVQQMMIEFAVKAADGTSFKRKVMATINVVGDQVIGD